jgi:hypothetical protein
MHARTNEMQSCMHCKFMKIIQNFWSKVLKSAMNKTLNPLNSGETVADCGKRRVHIVRTRGAYTGVEQTMGNAFYLFLLILMFCDIEI